MGRKATKIHFVNPDAAAYLISLKLNAQELIFRMPYAIHPQSLYAGLRGDAVTQETKEAIETLAASHRTLASNVPVPVWSTR